MLFFSLVAYWIVQTALYAVMGYTYGRWGAFWSTILALLIAPVVVVAFAYVVWSYHPRLHSALSAILRVNGVRWLCALTALGCVVFLAVSPLAYEVWPSVFLMTLILPLIAISSVNLVGIEFRLPWLGRLPGSDETLPGPIPPSPAPPTWQDDLILREMRWRCGEIDYDITLLLSRAEYESCRARPRVRDCSLWAQAYVTEGTTGAVQDLAREIGRIGQSYGTYEEVLLVLEMVRQVIAYQGEESEYPKYPLETLFDTCGDCEDFAILAAAILNQMGYDVALLYVPGHAALGIAGTEGLEGCYKEHKGTRYYYCEMTASGWEVGQVPPQHCSKDIHVCPVAATPFKVVGPANGPF